MERPFSNQSILKPLIFISLSKMETMALPDDLPPLWHEAMHSASVLANMGLYAVAQGTLMLPKRIEGNIGQKATIHDDMMSMQDNRELVENGYFHLEQNPNQADYQVFIQDAFVNLPIVVNGKNRYDALIISVEVYQEPKLSIYFAIPYIAEQDNIQAFKFLPVGIDNPEQPQMAELLKVFYHHLFDFVSPLATDANLKLAYDESYFSQEPIRPNQHFGQSTTQNFSDELSLAQDDNTFQNRNAFETGNLNVESLSIAELAKRSKNGDRVAQRVLGIRYLTGDGITQNLQEAERYLIKSAEQGDDIALDILEQLNEQLNYNPNEVRSGFFLKAMIIMMVVIAIIFWLS